MPKITDIITKIEAKTEIFMNIIKDLIQMKIFMILTKIEEIKKI